MSKETKQLIESPEVVVVEASAGSGKTYALAKRYVNILINSSLNKDYIPLRNILAITFTNKATLEMKARILELLKRIVFDDFENSAIANDIYSCFSLPKSQVRDKALAVMDKIVGHYSFFQVRTIDSFINNLLLGCALKIERSSKFRIERDCKENISYCLDWLIEQASANSEIFDLLEEFLEHYLFVENRKGWFPKEDILSLMVSLFQMSNKYGRLYHDYKGSSADLIKAKKKLFEKIRELSDPFCEGMNKIAQKSIKKFVDDDKPIFEIRAFPKSFLKDSPPLNKNVKCSLSYLDKWTAAHSLIREVVELESTISYNPYIKLFHRLLILFQDMAKQEDVLFLEELNRQARSLFDDDGMTVAEIYYRLAARFRHYLIDEFQDTSSLQWQNLFLMVEEALSSGGTLFYVGDKKQAIYRFRGGDVSLFDKIKDQFVHFNVKLKRLEKNWRSQKQIVEFNNKIFSKENLKEFLESSEIAEELNGSQTDIDEILEIFSDSSQEYKENNCNGYVYIERIEETNQKQRDDIVLDKVVSLIVELRDRRGLN
ncbi:MAG: UvrD-helicase domain-containing protein, partial [Candidatus Omnitrophica bacterium]|nr:UvrD-helicase domain-containing protein [Candidatus Omnitrophota bacterium]